MLSADNKLQKKRTGLKLDSILDALPIHSAARLLFATLFSAILIVAAGNSSRPSWLNAIVVVASLLPVLYFTYHLPARKKAAEKSLTTLRDSTEMFRVAFDYSTIGMALVFHTGRWHRVNRSLCDVPGSSERELLKKYFRDLLHPDDRFTAIAKLEQLLRSRVATYQTETRCIHKKGHTVWVLWSVSQALGEDSDWIGGEQ